MNKDLIQVSLGESPADLYIEGGKVINVFSGEIYEANVAVFRPLKTQFTIYSNSDILIFRVV
ncbi:MAG: hypothetical protein KGZ96_10890 [Clostridia bacterium]|nr:hypothetical protein [Clostridia bacterium]